MPRTLYFSPEKDYSLRSQNTLASDSGLFFLIEGYILYTDFAKRKAGSNLRAIVNMHFGDQEILYFNTNARFPGNLLRRNFCIRDIDFAANIDSEHGIIYTYRFFYNRNRELLETLSRNGLRPCFLPDSEFYLYGVNFDLVEANGQTHAIVSKDCHGTISILRSQGHIVIPVDISEFNTFVPAGYAFGGGIRCLTNRLYPSSIIPNIDIIEKFFEQDF